MATTGIINGTLLGVYFGGTKISKSTSASLSLSQELRETTTKDSSGWAEFLPGLRGWSISGDFLDAEDATYRYDDLFALINTRAAVTIKFSSEVSGDKYYTGSCYIESADREAPLEDNVSGSYVLRGTGALTEATV